MYIFWGGVNVKKKVQNVEFSISVNFLKSWIPTLQNTFWQVNITCFRQKMQWMVSITFPLQGYFSDKIKVWKCAVLGLQTPPWYNFGLLHVMMSSYSWRPCVVIESIFCLMIIHIFWRQECNIEENRIKMETCRKRCQISWTVSDIHQIIRSKLGKNWHLSEKYILVDIPDLFNILPKMCLTRSCKFWLEHNLKTLL